MHNARNSTFVFFVATKANSYCFMLLHDVELQRKTVCETCFWQEQCGRKDINPSALLFVTGRCQWFFFLGEIVLQVIFIFLTRSNTLSKAWLRTRVKLQSLIRIRGGTNRRLFFFHTEMTMSGSRGLWGAGPLAPKIFSKSCSFQAIVYDEIKTLFWANFGFRVLWGQNTTGPPWPKSWTCWWPGTTIGE